ncbi:MAG: hypothetical protein ACLP8S_01595 [Solirubrobacteraceae bacterium]|jgi:hypothetical protein
MSNYIDTTVQDIDSRLHELQEEVDRLQAARAALIGGVRRGPGRPRGSVNSNSTSVPAAASTVRKRARPGRPRGRRGGGTRRSQALELVRQLPGITIPQIAQTIRIEPNYLYRVMPKLVEEGLVTRDGLGYHPVDTPAEAPEPEFAEIAEG